MLAAIAAWAANCSTWEAIPGTGGYEWYLMTMVVVVVSGSLVQGVLCWLLMSGVEAGGAVRRLLLDSGVLESGYPLDELLAALEPAARVSGFLGVIGGIAAVVQLAALRRERCGSLRQQTRDSDSGAPPVSPPRSTAPGARLQTQAFSLAPRQEQESPAPDLGELLSSVVYFVSRNFRAFSALGFVYDHVNRCFVLNSYHSRSMSIVPGVRVGLGEGVVGRVGSDLRSFFSGDLSLYNVRPLYYTRAEQIHSVLAVPVLSDRQELVGALVVDSKDKNAFTDSDKENLKRFSVFAAALIGNVRMRLYQEQAARSFKTLYDASEAFARALHEEDLYATLAAVLGGVEQTLRVSVLSVEAGAGSVVVRQVVSNLADIGVGYTGNDPGGVYLQTARNATITVIDDYQTLGSAVFRFFPGETFPAYLRSLLIVPLVDETRNCMALVSLESGVPGCYRGELLTMLSTLAGNAAVALERARLYRQMETLATTDGLTGLYNHRRFQEQLAIEIDRSLRYRHPLSILLLDIDYFKKFNDNWGHPVGDQVLREIAVCICHSIRKTDYPARYGGEEFAVIMPETSIEQAHVTPERIRRAIEEHVILVGERQLHVTASIGWATFADHARTQSALIDSADKALYYSKEQGRNRVSRYHPRMG